MNLRSIRKSPRRNTVLLLAITLGVIGACQLPNVEPQEPSAPRLSVTGAPEREVKFDLRISGAGMETIDERVTIDDLGDLGPYEVPARTDITFSLTARDDVYTGRAVERFGPGEEGDVEIDIYPGPVFVDVNGGDTFQLSSGDVTSTLYQIRDAGVDIAGDDGGAVRSFTAGNLGLDGQIVDAEYGPEGLLWVLTTDSIFVFDSLEKEPIADVGLEIESVTPRAIAVSNEYVYVLLPVEGESIRHYNVTRNGDEVTVASDPTDLAEEDWSASINEATEAAFEEIDELSNPPSAFALQDIAARADGTLYATYTTGSVDFEEGLKKAYDQRILVELETALRGRQLRSAVIDSLEEEDQLAPEETDDELAESLDALELIDFGRQISIIEDIVALDLDPEDLQGAFEEEDFSDFSSALDELPDGLSTLVLNLADIYEPYFVQLEELGFFEEVSEGDNEVPSEFNPRESAEVSAFQYAALIVESSATDDFELEGIISELEFLDSLGGDVTDPEAIADLVLEGLDSEQGFIDVDEFLAILSGDDPDYGGTSLKDASLPISRERSFTATVALRPGDGSIVHDPVIHGPIFGGDGVPHSTLRFGGNSLFVAQSTVESDIADGMESYLKYDEFDEVETARDAIDEAIAEYVRRQGPEQNGSDEMGSDGVSQGGFLGGFFPGATDPDSDNGIRLEDVLEQVRDRVFEDPERFART
ncbi:MAG: hypothetical protein ACLFM0_09790, partial [Spirochaetales bacterium]